MDKNTQPSAVKKIQQRNLLLVVIGVVAALFAISYCLDNKTVATHKNHDKIDTISFATPLNHVDAQSVWIEHAQNQLAKNDKTTTALSQQLDFLQKEKDAQDKQAQQQAQTMQALLIKVDTLQSQLAHHGNMVAVNSNGFPGTPGSANSDGLGDNFISDDTLSLSPQKTAADSIPLKNPNTFVPAGTFVSAVMLGGADASAAVSSQGDPSPTLFRIVDQGTLPNHQHSHLKNCVATAAAIGDISSERGEIRLERLSCTRNTGEIVEIPVEATVFGPDGKNGVRGTPLWREGSLLARAFAAGTLSGLSSGIAQSYTTSSLTPLGGTTQTVDNNKIMQFGLASGVGNAAEKLAEYNIKRAEQYHPVIQISAGQTVDIVFLKGFYLDGKKHSENDQEQLPPVMNSSMTTNASANTANVNYANTGSQTFNGAPSPLPLTPQQIQTLKQKNAEQGFQ